MENKIEELKNVFFEPFNENVNYKEKYIELIKIYINSNSQKEAI